MRMFKEDDKTNVGEVMPVLSPSVKREETKINRVEDSHHCQRQICHISPFFKETALSISSILSDHTYLLLEGQPSKTSSNQVGQLIKSKIRDRPLLFSAPRDKLDRYHRVLTLLSTYQEVLDLGML
jgi:hypothetical protein